MGKINLILSVGLAALLTYVDLTGTWKCPRCGNEVEMGFLRSLWTILTGFHCGWCRKVKVRV